ncbi:hypothetical protein [Streptomyces sp. NPDC053367]|uniref:hypothetical protein n=1 Tax=Streptomyces sp. NPDC053367 TaxID=3365700 RepID=UPI0037D59AD6
MSLKKAVQQVNTSLGGLRRSLTQSASGMASLQRGATGATAPLSGLRNGSNQAATAVGKLRTSVRNSNDAVTKLRSGLRSSESSLTKAKSGSDKLKSSLDKLKSSAKGAQGELKKVKSQSDAVEKSVGKAAKNADKGGKSMGSLGKGLKGASLAQKGLNLAMAANPFGLVMTLLAPLIAQFVNMDKVTAVLRRTVSTAMRIMGSAMSGLAKNAGPILRGLGNAMLAPMTGLATAVNGLLGALAGIHINIPDWVPKFGGRSFGFPRLHVPVPHLATGGVVQARSGGTLALLGEAGESEAVIPLSKLERMLGHGGGLRALTSAVERLADRPVVVQVDSQEIARAVFLGRRQLARR